MKGVDEYQELLRISAASAGNDHRLGASEAPPAIVSMFLGTDLSEILEAIEKDEKYDPKQKDLMRIGVHTLPKFPRDTTDRNRTSPFAFTGNKFEFRMLGSAASISCANTVLNTAVAEELLQFADKLEGATDFESALHDLIKETVANHKRIIFNGDSYDDAWVKEAEKRGLRNLRTTPEALSCMLDKKNIELFESHKVFTLAELKARHAVRLENYCKIVNIEALTMIDMVKRDILPAMSKYSAEIANAGELKRKYMSDCDCSYETETTKKLSSLIGKAHKEVIKLENDLGVGRNISDKAKLADMYKNDIISDMEALRESVDAMEEIAASSAWPYPTYGELLFGVR